MIEFHSSDYALGRASILGTAALNVPSNDLPQTAYPFYGQLARIINSGQARSIVLSGNIYDLYFDGKQYVPIIPFLQAKTASPGLIQVVYELNGPVRVDDEAKNRLREAWAAWKCGTTVDAMPLKEVLQDGSKFDLRRREFDQYLRDAIGSPTQALEFMRQLTICSRTSMKENLLILIEGADMLLPAGDGDVSKMNDALVRRIAIVTDWFGDPAFFAGRDTVVLIAESRSIIHPRISRLPQVLSVDIPAPDTALRKHFAQWHTTQPPKGKSEQPFEMIGQATAGLAFTRCDSFCWLPIIPAKRSIERTRRHKSNSSFKANSAKTLLSLRSQSIRSGTSWVLPSSKSFSKLT